MASKYLFLMATSPYKVTFSPKNRTRGTLTSEKTSDSALSGGCGVDIWSLPKRPLPAKQPKCHSPVSQTDNFLAQTIGGKCVERDVRSGLQEQIKLRTCGHPAMLALSPPHHYRTVLTLLLLIRCVSTVRACSVKVTAIE